MAGVTVGAVFGVGCLILAVVWCWTTSRRRRSSRNNATMGAETTNHLLHKHVSRRNYKSFPGKSGLRYCKLRTWIPSFPLELRRMCSIPKLHKALQDLKCCDKAYGQLLLRGSQADEAEEG